MPRTMFQSPAALVRDTTVKFYPSNPVILGVLLHTTDFPVSSLLLHVVVAQQMKPAHTLPAASQMRLGFVFSGEIHAPMDTPHTH